MKTLVFLLSIIAGLTSIAQDIDNNKLVVGHTDKVYSTILKEDRTIWISLPRSYRPSGSIRYPVVYVLDGNNHFASVSAMLRQLSPQDGNEVFPDMIVVGILNTNRNRDMTPYSSKWFIYPTNQDFGYNGGGDQFASFFEKELFPHIDSLYPTAPYRILIGHSLAGLATTNMLVSHTNLFNAYIAVDPSMWYDNRKFLLQQVKPALQQRKFDGVRFYLGIANSVRAGLDTVGILKDTSAATFHMRSIFLLRNIVQQNTRNGLRFGWKYYSDDSHMSAPLITIYDGLRFIFDYYPIDIDAGYYAPGDGRDPSELLRKHFEEVSKQIGYTMLPPENMVNLFANSFADLQIDKKEESLRRLNAANYPQSFDANVAMGDYYASHQEKKGAREYYQKALSIKQDEATAQKLKQLGEGQ